jgi:hypothetical protein
VTNSRCKNLKRTSEVIIERQTITRIAKMPICFWSRSCVFEYHSWMLASPWRDELDRLGLTTFLLHDHQVTSPTSRRAKCHMYNWPEIQPPFFPVPANLWCNNIGNDPARDRFQYSIMSPLPRIHGEFDHMTNIVQSFH